MVEDFDEDGNVRSSVPVHFLAIVWTPEEDYIGIAEEVTMRRGGNNKTFSFPDLFGPEAHDDHDHDPSYLPPLTVNAPPRENMNTMERFLGGYAPVLAPDYCLTVPELAYRRLNEVPEVWYTDSYRELIVDDAIQGTKWIAMRATTENGSIVRYITVKPLGMKCTSINALGNSACFWDPTDNQIGPHVFCFQAEDSMGIMSERKCIYLIPKHRPQVIDTETMVEHFMPGTAEILKKYGCAQVGESIF